MKFSLVCMVSMMAVFIPMWAHSTQLLIPCPTCSCLSFDLLENLRQVHKIFIEISSNWLMQRSC